MIANFKSGIQSRIKNQESRIVTVSCRVTLMTLLLPHVTDLQQRLKSFMEEHIYQNEAIFHAEIAQGDRWQPTSIVESLKSKARAAGLWNLFLPESEYAAGLTTAESAPLCEIMGGAP